MSVDQGATIVISGVSRPENAAEEVTTYTLSSTEYDGGEISDLPIGTQLKIISVPSPE